MTFDDILVEIDNFIWGIPLIVMILAVGVLLTFKLKLLQIFHLPKALRFMFKNEKEGDGEVSSFGALCTALCATVGTGNIVGVATALCTGGPGALFWMVVAAFFGMATKYAEGFLAVKYRKVNSDGKIVGGPFYYIQTGIKENFGLNFKPLAVMFAFFGVCVGLFGIGTFTQINGITGAFKTLIPSKTVFAIGKDHPITLTTIIVGVIIAALVALVLIGGLKRISRVAEIVVPFMIIAYIGSCVLLLIYNADQILPAFKTIVAAAFNPKAVTGGVVGSVFVAMQKGIARGIFSNEAGLGSAPIAAAAAKTNEPVRQGLVCMTGTFIDTIIVCTMTGLAIVITGSWNIGLEGTEVTLNAFKTGLPFNSFFSEALLCISLSAFAFTTILGWNYYGEKCLEYLVGNNKKVILSFRWLYIAAVFAGPYLTVSAIWTIADIFNALMALPNLIALVMLSKVISKDTKEYFKRTRKQ